MSAKHLNIPTIWPLNVLYKYELATKLYFTCHGTYKPRSLVKKSILTKKDDCVGQFLTLKQQT